MEHSISLQEVTKRVDDFTLGPVTMQLEPGYVVALVGPNGSGKSTLFRLLMNLIPADAGTVRVLGQRYAEAELELKRRIGYVPDTAYGLEDLTAAKAGHFLQQVYPEWDEHKFARLLERYRIEPHHKYKKLSKGTQRKLACALALAHDSQLLLLDEPTANLDPFATKLIFEDIAAYMESGERTVLLATHSLEEVRRIADYVAFLCEGQLLGVFEKDTILDQWKVIWVDRLPLDADRLPGVVEVQMGTPARLVTSDRMATEIALQQSGIGIVKVLHMELDEILAGLMRVGGHGR